MDELLVIYLSLKELVFLGSLLGGETLVGVADPFILHTKEQIEDEWLSLQKSLEEKHYIKVTDGENISIEQDIASLLLTCCNPEACILMNHRSDPFSFKKVFYITGLSAVALSIPMGSSPTCILRVMPTIDHIKADLLEGLSTLDKYLTVEHPHLPISISDSDFQEMISSTKEVEGKTAISLLLKNGFDEKTAYGLFEALCNPVSQTTVLLMEDLAEDEITGNGFGLYEGENGCWMVRPSSDSESEQVECSLLSENKLNTEVARILDKLYDVFLFTNQETLDQWEELLSPVQ